MLRSILFVPGDRPERFDKALASGADAVIQDLEDAVAPQNKDQARKAVEQSFALANANGTRRFVRINALDTVHSFDDLQDVVRPGLEAIVLPKTQGPQDVHVVSYFIEQLELRRDMPAGGVAIIPLIETALGTRQVAAIAAAPRVKTLTFGAVDLSVELGLDFGEEARNFAQLRWQLVTEARIAGLDAPIDTVFIDLADTEGLAVSATQARAGGFQGKLCLHPRQVTIVNDAFSPTASEIERARTIEDAMQKSGAGVAMIDGKMIDRPVVEWARRTLDYARRAGRLG